MQNLGVNLKGRAYNIFIGSNVIKFLGNYTRKLNIGTDAYVITNAFIKHRYGSILNRTLKKVGFNVRFKIIPDTEKSKSIKEAFLIIRDIAKFDKQRKIFIVAFGGGVIGDLAGFIASIYKRGIPYIQVPTTLLAQVDSSIGGKTAVDLKEGKNLVGAFYQPRAVFSDIGLLKSLNARQIRCGLAEIIKYAIIKDPQMFAYLEKNYKDIFALKESVLSFIIKRSSLIKAKIVELDEREEKGIRTILNFGHTIGHAIEAASNYKGYSHGEAIALGMLVACDISRRLGLINTKTQLRIENLIRTVGLPIKICGVSMKKILEAHYHDKKFLGSKNRFVLIRGIGKTKIIEGIPLKLIREALRKRF